MSVSVVIIENKACLEQDIYIYIYMRLTVDDIFDIFCG